MRNLKILVQYSVDGETVGINQVMDQMILNGDNDLGKYLNKNREPVICIVTRSKINID